MTAAAHSLTYRPEIDGLRAIAVLPVMFFHAGFAAFSGGFVGVDIFFVLSGYLITSIIMGEAEQGRFSLLRFYERRARRILPPLLLVVAATIPFAYFWMTRQQWHDYAESLVGVATFSSNILFWLQTDYFATASELKPLLHTWSLAVEEQFYIIFPLLVMLMMRVNRRALLPVLLSSLWPVWVGANMQRALTHLPISTCCPAAHGNCWPVPAAHYGCAMRPWYNLQKQV
jgi:peptidoglycan/LPS O-acetylase OafA/YrhL